MKRLIELICTLLIVGCSSHRAKKTIVAPLNKDNAELLQMYKDDQTGRQGQINWQKLIEEDRLRRARVYELLDSSLINTSSDYYHAAMIFQHGNDSVSSGMAVKLIKKAIALDSTTNKWLLAAAIDRDLMRRGKPQIYGTQYIKTSIDKPFERYILDSTRVTDAERIKHGVETLEEQQVKLKRLNKKKLYELLVSGKPIEEIVQFCKKETVDTSEYDLSEAGINSFGYQLMAQNKVIEALKIFDLNIELYPDAFNTYDSYGECLLKLDRVEESIMAYEKSLELNPNNQNAAQVLLKLKE